MSSTDAAPATSPDTLAQEQSQPQQNPQSPSSPSATPVPSSDVAQNEPEPAPAVAPSDIEPTTVVASTDGDSVDRQMAMPESGNAQDGLINGQGAAQEIVIGQEASTDEGQQWYQEGDNHELKRVKVSLLFCSPPGAVLHRVGDKSAIL